MSRAQKKENKTKREKITKKRVATFFVSFGPLVNHHSGED